MTLFVIFFFSTYFSTYILHSKKYIFNEYFLQITLDKIQAVIYIEKPMTTQQKHINYILNAVNCEVCGKGFTIAEDAVDAGTDLYVHRTCEKDWSEINLNYYLNLAAKNLGRKGGQKTLKKYGKEYYKNMIVKRWQQIKNQKSEKV